MSSIEFNSIKNIHKISIAPMMDCTDKHFRMIMRKISSKSSIVYGNDCGPEFSLYDKKKIF